MNCLVTGANGFVGHAILKKLTKIEGYKSFGAVRMVALNQAPSWPKNFNIGNLE